VRDYRESSTLTSQQLAEQELPSGWSLTWAAPSWIIPADAFQYTGLTPIAAIAKIAEAGGGYIQSDLTLNRLHIKQRYPFAPWTWDLETPDFAVPKDIILQRSSTKKPGLGKNGVYVHGEVGGVLALVRRNGTAGDKLLGTIVDPLISDTLPARHRGINALAGAMRQSTETHELPLDGALGGLILPGSLLGVGAQVSGSFVKEWTGMVNGVTVTANAARAGDRGVNLRVRQQLNVERFFED
jgi:hypothetical protein